MSQDLNLFLPLVEKVISKVEDTHLEKPWKDLHKLIESADKLNPDKILLIEQTLESVKEKLLKCNNLNTNEDASSSSTKTKRAKESSSQEVTLPRQYKRIKFLPLKSPRRETIPPLKIKLSDIYRIKRLKKIRREEKKKNKKLRLFFVQRGQSIKREIKTPHHQPNFEEAPIVNNNFNSQEPNDHEKSNEAIKTPQLRNFSIVLNRVANNTPVNLQNNSNDPQNSKCSGESNASKKQKRKRGSAKKWHRPKTHVNSTKNSQAYKESKENPKVTTLSPLQTSHTQPTVNENSSLKKNNQNSIEPDISALKEEEVDNSVIIIEEERKSPPMIRIRNDLLMPALVRQGAISAFSTQQRIRPWLRINNDHQKNALFCTSMLSNDHCLASLYKCMAQRCEYFTNNSSLFYYHLGYHMKYERDEKTNFLQCAYCSFATDTVDPKEALKTYINHIKTEHGTSRYQCSYCFFRSYDYHIVAHMKVFHPFRPESLIKVQPMTTFKVKEELALIWKNFFTTCRTISCIVCKARFLNITHFHTHFESHDSIPSSKCKKCSSEINKETIMHHLKTCHGFGNSNCAFCDFTTDSMESLKIHLSNNHSNKSLMFFDRAHNVNMETMPNSDIKKLVLKQLTITLSPQWIINTYPQHCLENALTVKKNFEQYLK